MNVWAVLLLPSNTKKLASVYISSTAIYWLFSFFPWRHQHSIYRGYYTVARRYEFYFRLAKQHFMNERREWVKYCFCQEKIKFISSSRRVMFFLLYRKKDIDKMIDFYTPKSNCDGSNLQYSNIYDIGYNTVKGLNPGVISRGWVWSSGLT